MDCSHRNTGKFFWIAFKVLGKDVSIEALEKKISTNVSHSDRTLAIFVSSSVRQLYVTFPKYN